MPNRRKNNTGNSVLKRAYLILGGAVNAEPVGILPTPSRSRCGKKGFDSGQDGEADMAEWPWHAAILEKPQDLYVCGSTLLDESWILTAAHCVDDYLPYVESIGEILKGMAAIRKS